MYTRKTDDFMTNVDRANGWTPEIVEQAAVETGAKVVVKGPTGHLDPSASFSIWALDNKDKGEFWQSARRLIDESAQPQAQPAT